MTPKDCTKLFQQYDALFDYETGIWMEGPDYLMNLFEDALDAVANTDEYNKINSDVRIR